MRDAGENTGFGALLRRHRLALGLTQEELAERSGVGARTIQNLERGANGPRVETLARLADSLRLDAEVRDGFEAAGRPRSRGPRGERTLLEGEGRSSRPEIVSFVEWRAAPASGRTPRKRPSEVPADGHPLGAPNNLPLQRTSFIGREAAIGEVRRLLQSSHLVTLTGTGGCGKTRLALEVAGGMADQYPDGIWLVELDPLSDPALVGPTVASTMGVREVPGKPISGTLIEHLRAKLVLLIVDNCEHLIDAAALLADSLLSGCPGLTVLATSREALRVPGEIDWRVPSLSLGTEGRRGGAEEPKSGSSAPSPFRPSVTSLSEAEQLFFERARAARADFAVTDQNLSVVAQICQRLDGIPLAIELAATRVKVASVEQIAARLDRRFELLTAGSRVALPRQQTLAAMVAWSYDLLTETERSLFDRLSVFAGAFTLEAAEEVCGGGDTFDLLGELVGKSLVVADGGVGGVERYHLLETLRQYGRERLVAAGEDEAVQRRHASYYLRLAEEAKPRQFGPEQLDYLARLDRELDNLRAAFRWFLDRREAEDGLRLLAALEFFLWYRGLDQTEGHAWRAQLLRLPTSGAPSAARANALMWTALAPIDLGELDEARRLFLESLTVARQLEDDRILAWVMHRISRYGGPDRKRWYGASDRELAEGALALYQAAGDRWGIVINLAWLGYLEAHGGDPKRARELLAESLAMARAIGERHCVAFALRFLGEVISAESDAEARTYLDESLRLYRELGDIQGQGYVELVLGRHDIFYQRFARAREHFRAALCWFYQENWREMLAQALDGLALAAAGEGGKERALRLAAASAKTSSLIAQTIYPIERADLDRALAPARETLGEAGAATATAEGRAMTLEEAIAYALGEDDAKVNRR